MILIILLAWPLGLLWWANSRLQHVEALSDKPATSGTTFLLAGSDSREDGEVDDATEGARTDSILLLHRAANGQTALVSLPRDTFVEIPGVGAHKLNASYAYGGAPLLVDTVEQLTGLSIDHYVEVGMGGVREIVDAVGGVNLCLDFDVNDELSNLTWKAGCHEADGPTALAFSRMRYSDPRGDMGRQDRQRQVIGAIVKKAARPSFLLNPFSQRTAVTAGTDALRVDENANIFTLVTLARYFRAASAANLHGHPPIASYNFQPGGIGVAVKLDHERAIGFFDKLRTGNLTEADLHQVP
ncbi:MAG: LCP family protein [Bowdeniella nasicola]|nr:LCP family protein [Bowdeniella nasicola]